MMFSDVPALRSADSVRRACVVAGDVLLLAACAPQFQRVGPAPGPATAAASPITIEHIVLRWSNVSLIRKAGAAVLVDAVSPSDHDALAAALAGASGPRRGALG